MARKRTLKPDPFKTITRSHLDHVVGGRIAVAKGPDPQVLQGIKTLAETVGQVGQVFQQKQAEKGAQMQQMMQQMMGGRR